MAEATTSALVVDRWRCFWTVDSSSLARTTNSSSAAAKDPVAVVFKETSNKSN